MMSQGKQRLLLFVYIGGLMLNLALCATLIPMDPLLGTCLAMLITKAAVAVATTTYCQVSMRIIDIKSMWRIAAACAAGAALYFATYRFGIREIPEILALVPFIFLVRQWQKEFKAQKAQAGMR